MTAMIDRRTLLKLSAAWIGGAVAQSGAGRAQPSSATYLVPGYHPELALAGGVSAPRAAALTKAVPGGWDGPLTMVSRIDEATGAVDRAIFPVSGHQICAHPTRREALLASMNGRTMALFGTDDLTLHALAEADGSGFTGGGHAAYTQDGGVLAVSERGPLKAYAGNPADHYGRIVVRDPTTLAVLDSRSSHGIEPHEIALIDDDRVLVVANYGSPPWPADQADGAAAKLGLPYVVEPCLAIIELASGRLLEKLWAAEPETEIRHLAAASRARLFAIQARMAPPDAVATLYADDRAVVDQDRAAGGPWTYMPAPVLRFAPGESRGRELPPAEPLLSRQGQSIIYDPTHDQAIATFTSGNSLMVFDGASGAVIHALRTDRVGLRYPRGVALHPDGVHYVVSGAWNDLFVFRRGRHDLVRERCIYETFFEHSHLTIV